MINTAKILSILCLVFLAGCVGIYDHPATAPYSATVVSPTKTISVIFGKTTRQSLISTLGQPMYMGSQTGVGSMLSWMYAMNNPARFIVHVTDSTGETITLTGIKIDAYFNHSNILVNIMVHGG
ncbi:MAG: hypothetical protein LBS60_09015 [Deltaproteobacteria bacterium]|jgi:hypothetical protein|nr:hypothetical protein [Deltaproteobacteria bacterium]